MHLSFSALPIPLYHPMTPEEVPHSLKIDNRSCPYSGVVTVVEAVHLFDQFVQLQGANPQDLDPEVVWVLKSRNINLEMFIRLEAQVWTGNWTTQKEIQSLYDMTMFKVRL